jgi:predicted metalloendopeptidase
MKPTSMIASADEGGIGLPDRAYYVDKPSASVLPAYRAHIAMLAPKLGVTDPGMADAVVRIETALATAMLTADGRRDPLATYHVEPLAALAQALPHFDLASYLGAERLPSLASLNVAVPAFFTALDLVLAQTSLADLKRYLSWRAIEALAGSFGEDVVTEEYRFHAGTFYGFTRPLPRDEYCLRLTTSALSWSVSALYARRVGAVLLPEAEPIVARLRQALRDDLSHLDWLDNPTRAAAIAKLDALRAGVVAPDDFSGYETDLTTVSASFPAAIVQLRQRERARSNARIGGNDMREWFLAPITVNAAYSPTLNAINIPAAILQSPLFDPSVGEVVNFGGIGTVIGHELTHGFDDQGRKFDATGGLADSWSAATKAQFDARAECVVQQYGNIAPAPGTHIDGQLTLGENIADLGGVKLAYAALHPTNARTSSFNDRQLFFLSYAQSWCTNLRPEALASSLRTDPHSPASARVNAVLADTPEFAAAFSCQPGKPMAPAKACAVW